MVCSNCRKAPVKYTKSALCSTCGKYEQRHGKPRPQSLITPPCKPQTCKVCGSGKVFSWGMCQTCDGYKRRTGKNRPRALFADDPICKNCKRPLRHLPNRQRQHRRMLCTACADYERCNHKPRPQHLWGVGPHGWCECGWPAIEMIEGMALCKGCVELERS